jgi:hypothetical protein
VEHEVQIEVPAKPLVEEGLPMLTYYLGVLLLIVMMAAIVIYQMRKRDD